MNTTTTTIRMLGAALLVLALAGNTAGQGLAPVDRGGYTVLGGGGKGYGYSAGNCPACNADYRRNFFVFDLGCVPDTITSATLSIELNIGGYQSVHAAEIFGLFDVSTAPEVIMAGTGGLPAYEDLGTGTLLGSASVKAADEGTAISVPLNADGLAYLNAHLGGLVALGGDVTTLDAFVGTKELLFGSSTDWAVRLIVTPSCTVRDADDRGWYRDDGFHDPSLLNYAVGNGALQAEYRNFFALSTDGLGGLVTAATLALEDPYGLVSQDGTETYQLFEVSTPEAALLDGSAGVAAFDDLADGPVYGAVTLAVADGQALVKVPLSANGLVALNEAGGGNVLIGGALTTLDGDPTTWEASFGSQSPFHGISQMLFEVEPQWSWLGGGTEGDLGQPLLLGYGPLTAGSQASVELTNAPPNALALAWLSFGPTMPFAALGGTVQAWPFNNQFLFQADPSGTFTGSTVWPAGAPSGTNVWFQFVVQDASSIHGLTLSNGLLATTP